MAELVTLKLRGALPFADIFVDLLLMSIRAAFTSEKTSAPLHFV